MAHVARKSKVAQALGPRKPREASSQATFCADGSGCEHPSRAPALRFGPTTRSPYIKHMDEHPDIIAVLKEADEARISTFGNAWHSDFSFLEEPPLGSLLYAREVPSHGGDTLFANMYLAYEALSDGMKRMLDPLKAIHTGKPYGVGGVSADLRVSRSIGIERNRPEADREIAHPIVRLHPVTGCTRTTGCATSRSASGLLRSMPMERETLRSAGTPPMP